MQNTPPTALNKDSDEDWADLEHHHIMLSDRKRMVGYRNAIRRAVRSEHRVLDIGCGTGILSLFAAQAGAASVCAVERSEELVRYAREIAEENRLSSKIEFVAADILQFAPKARFDVLVQEQLGQFVWDEDMVAKVAHIRDNFLTPDARLIPSKVDVYLAPVDYKTRLERSLDFWSRDIFGFDYRPMQSRVFSQQINDALLPSIIDLTDTACFLSPAKLVHTIDLATESAIPAVITASFRVQREGFLRGVCGYFRAESDGKTMFSTKPSAENTHWKQFILPCFEASPVTKGSVVDVKMSPAVKPKDWKFTISVR